MCSGLGVQTWSSAAKRTQHHHQAEAAKRQGEEHCSAVTFGMSRSHCATAGITHALLQLQRWTVFCSWRMRVTARGTKRVQSASLTMSLDAVRAFSAAATQKKPLLLVQVEQRSRRVSTVYLWDWRRTKAIQPWSSSTAWMNGFVGSGKSGRGLSQRLHLWKRSFSLGVSL